MEIHAVSCHSPVCGCWKGTQSTEVNKEKEIRASSNVTELRQNCFFFLGLFFGPPKHEEIQCYLRKHGQNAKHMQNHMHFVLAKVSKILQCSQS